MPISFSSRYLLIPFVLQMLCMAVDELYFHRQRTLPRWERLGHPLDTLLVLGCLGWLLAVPPEARALGIYVGLSICSCLFVTKDELVHRQCCSAAEHWLHAVLFTLHPLVLLSAGLLWPAWHGLTLAWLPYEGFEREFLLGSTLLTFGFGLYQFIYWNFVWPQVLAKPNRSTTISTTS
jgi:hypothetical protein